MDCTNQFFSILFDHFPDPLFLALFCPLGRSWVPSGAQHGPKTSPRRVSRALLGRISAQLGPSSFLKTSLVVLLHLWCPGRSLGEVGSLKNWSSDTRCVTSAFANVFLTSLGRFFAILCRFWPPKGGSQGEPRTSFWRSCGLLGLSWGQDGPKTPQGAPKTSKEPQFPQIF